MKKILVLLLLFMSMFYSGSIYAATVYGLFAVAAGTCVWSILDASASAKKVNQENLGFSPVYNPDTKTLGASFCFNLR